MKKALLGLALLAAHAHAGSYLTTFGFGAVLTEAGYTGMELDITGTGRFYGVNGSLKSNSGLFSPVSGTCQPTPAGGVFCLLQSGFVSYILDLGPNLTGTIKITDGGGAVFGATSVTLSSLR